MRNRHQLSLLLLAAALATLGGCTSSNGSKTGKTRSVVLVSPTPLADNSAGEYSGTVEEGKSVNAAFMADGRIARILVKEGDRVHKGQLLALLDDSDYRIGVGQLRSQYKQMTEEKRRMDEMWARHNIAPNDYEKFTAGYEQLGLQLQMAENKLGYTRLLAPSGGFVAEKFMEPEELVGAGTPVVRITDDSRLLVSVDLPVSVFLNKDKITRALGVSPTLPDVEIPLSTESFAPDAGNNMLYHMKLAIPAQHAKSLTPGMNLRVRIVMESQSAGGCLIPARAIFADNGSSCVWVFYPADSTIHRKTVSAQGVPSGKLIAVSGLEGTERIVETGVKQLYEGEKVCEVRNADFGL